MIQAMAMNRLVVRWSESNGMTQRYNDNGKGLPVDRGVRSRNFAVEQRWILQAIGEYQ